MTSNFKLIANFQQSKDIGAASYSERVHGVFYCFGISNASGQSTEHREGSHVGQKRPSWSELLLYPDQP